MTSAGLLNCATRDGELLWQRSLMSEFGRLTFPNGRTGAPVIDGELAILHAITSHWGPETPAFDRFYAFDKRTGLSTSGPATPGEPARSTTRSPIAVLAWHERSTRALRRNRRRGNVVCIDARTGDALWRFKMATGGLNSAVLLHGDSVIAIHGRENLDTLDDRPHGGDPAARVRRGRGSGTPVELGAGARAVAQRPGCVLQLAGARRRPRLPDQPATASCAASTRTPARCSGAKARPPTRSTPRRWRRTASSTCR